MLDKISDDFLLPAPYKRGNKASPPPPMNSQLMNGRARTHRRFLTADTEVFAEHTNHWAGEQSEQTVTRVGLPGFKS